MEVPHTYGIVLGLGMCALLAVSHRLRSVTDPVRRQWISTAVGVLCVVGKGRWRAVHLVVLLLVNALVIIHGSKRHCHKICFAFSFAYLTFYSIEIHYHILPTHAMINLFMMITVFRMVHLAGEVEDAYSAELDARTKVCSDPTLGDVVHYSLCHVGLMAFYRYATYHDWVHRPLHPHADCDGEVARRVKMMLVVAPCVFLVDRMWPIKAVLSEYFYEQTFTYKFLYASYAGMLWSLLVAGAFVVVDVYVIASGMGAYPVSTNPRPGRGPTVNLELLDTLADNPEKAKLEKYNFHAIRGIFLYKAAFAPRYRDFWRNYNCCAQYFLATNVYKRFAIKKYRLLATFAVTAMWHSATPFWYMALFFIVVTIAAEDLWYSLYRKDATGLRADIVDGLFWSTRLVGHPIMLLAVTYVDHLHQVLRLLGSIYYTPYLFPMLMFGLGMHIRHMRRQGSQQQEHIKKGNISLPIVVQEI